MSKRAAVRRLHEEGLNDHQIAERTGMTFQNARYHRNAQRLPSNFDGRNPAYTDDLRQRLTDLWNEGRSARLIGVDLGLTKNQVIGLAHRMNLPSRPSPFAKPYKAARRGHRPALALVPPSELEPPVPSAQPAQQGNPRGTCQFIHGDVPKWPAEPHYCGKPALPGKPWCAGCRKNLYIKRAPAELAAE